MLGKMAKAASGVASPLVYPSGHRLLRRIHIGCGLCRTSIHAHGRPLCISRRAILDCLRDEFCRGLVPAPLYGADLVPSSPILEMHQLGCGCCASRLGLGAVRASTGNDGRVVSAAEAGAQREGYGTKSVAGEAVRCQRETSFPKSAREDPWNGGGCFIEPISAGPSTSYSLGFPIVVSLIGGSGGKAAGCRFYVGRWRRRAILPRFLRADSGQARPLDSPREFTHDDPWTL